MEWVSVSRLFGIAFAVCWVVYFALFARLLRQRHQKGESDPASFLGLILQFAALGVLFLLGRETALASLLWNSAGLGLGVLGVEISRRALGHLGRQWSLGAQLNRKHRLVTEGAYSRVRHPLYLAFFLLTAGTGLAFSNLPGLLLALPLSLSGAGIRISVEERLLRQEFGKAYIRYASRVPALIPRLRQDAEG